MSDHSMSSSTSGLLHLDWSASTPVLARSVSRPAKWQSQDQGLFDRCNCLTVDRVRKEEGGKVVRTLFARVRYERGELRLARVVPGM